VELGNTPVLEDRVPILERKVAATKELNLLSRQRSAIVDELVKIDNDMV